MAVLSHVLSHVALIVVVFAVVAAVGNEQSTIKTVEAVKRCRNQVKAPQRIEKTISECQDEIKRAILQEVLGELNVKQAAAEQLANTAQQVVATEPSVRVKRDAFDNDERRIAGCLLHCVYRKVKAVDENGFPTVEGLVRIYTEGIEEQEYFTATERAAQKCISQAHAKETSIHQASTGKTLCDVAYDMFECVTTELDAYCSGTQQ